MMPVCISKNKHRMQLQLTALACYCSKRVGGPSDSEVKAKQEEIKKVSCSCEFGLSAIHSHTLIVS